MPSSQTWYGLHASSAEAEVSTYSTEFDGSQDFSNTLLTKSRETVAGWTLKSLAASAAVLRVAISVGLITNAKAGIQTRNIRRERNRAFSQWL